jgi:hypothetical protein
MALKTRLFTLIWDNSKLPRLEYSERMRPRVAEGVHFSSGIVALSNGVVFESRSEMESSLKAYGKVELTYQDEVAEEEQRQLL